MWIDFAVYFITSFAQEVEQGASIEAEPAELEIPTSSWWPFAAIGILAIASIVSYSAVKPIEKQW